MCSRLWGPDHKGLTEQAQTRESKPLAMGKVDLFSILLVRACLHAYSQSS